MASGFFPDKKSKEGNSLTAAGIGLEGTGDDARSY